MKPGTLIRVNSVLLGAILAVGVTASQAQLRKPVPLLPSQTSHTEISRAKQLPNEERADIFMARKQFSDAITYYVRAIESYRNTSENKPAISKLWNKIGVAYQQEMDYGKARRAYRKSIKLNRRYARPWNNLGTTYYLQRRVKKSTKYYRRAIKLDPSSAPFHLNLGTAYFIRKKYQKAYVQYRTAIQLDPGILTQNSREGSAIETRHVNGTFYFYMAKAFASLGYANKAVEYLERAMEDGFNNEKRILNDPDIKRIAKDPAFIALMKNPPVPIGK